MADVTYQPSPDDVEAFRAACDGCDMLTDGYPGLLTRAAKFFHSRGWRDAQEVNNLRDNINTRSSDIRRLESALDAARAEVERLRADYTAACQTIANMHAAAVGAIRGPNRGIVEDVTALRADRDAL